MEMVDMVITQNWFSGRKFKSVNNFFKQSDLGLRWDFTPGSVVQTRRANTGCLFVFSALILISLSPKPVGITEASPGLSPGTLDQGFSQTWHLAFPGSAEHEIEQF